MNPGKSTSSILTRPVVKYLDTSSLSEKLSNYDYSILQKPKYFLCCDKECHKGSITHILQGSCSKAQDVTMFDILQMLNIDTEYIINPNVEKFLNMKHNEKVFLYFIISKPNSDSELDCIFITTHSRLLKINILTNLDYFKKQQADHNINIEYTNFNFVLPADYALILQLTKPVDITYIMNTIKKLQHSRFDTSYVDQLVKDKKRLYDKYSKSLIENKDLRKSLEKSHDVEKRLQYDKTNISRRYTQVQSQSYMLLMYVGLLIVCMIVFLL